MNRCVSLYKVLHHDVGKGTSNNEIYEEALAEPTWGSELLLLDVSYPLPFSPIRLHSPHSFHSLLLTTPLLDI